MEKADEQSDIESEVKDGAGCFEIWETLSELRNKETEE